MRYSHRASSRCWTVSSLAPEGRGNRGNRSVPSSLDRGSALPGGGFGGRPLLGLLGRGSLFPGGALLPLLASGGFSRALLVRRRWRSHPRFRNRRRTGGRRRCRPRPCWRRLMNRLRSRTVLPRCCCRCLRRVRDWLRPVSRRWQMGEVWRTRRMFRRCRRWRWRRRTRCRHLRLRRPIFSRCRRSGRRRYHRGDMPGLLHRLLCRIRPDPRGGQMREVRRTRSMAGRRRRRRRVGGRGRCWGCRRRGLASSPGGRLHTSWCRRRFLRGLRYGADARRRSELREIRPDGRTRHGRVCGFGLSGGRRRRAYRRRGTGLLDDFVGAGKD